MKKWFRAPLIGVLAIILVLSFGLVTMASAQGSQSVFSDVQAGDANAMFINYLDNKGLIKGFADGTFRPYNGLTRAEAAALLVRMADLNTTTTTAAPFSDVAPDFWAAGSINAAATAGLIGGYPDGTFHPNAVLSRAEGITIILRLSKQVTTGVLLPPLTDVNADHWAAHSIAIGLAAGMVGLTEDKQQFLPDAPFTRGDLARAAGILLTQEPNLAQTSLEGQLKVLKGTVTLETTTEAPVRIQGTTVVQPGQIFKTGTASEAEIIYPDGTGILIKENTVLAVKESRGRSYIMGGGNPNTAVDWLNLELKQGEIFTALASKHETSSVKTTGIISYPQVAALENASIKGLVAATVTAAKTEAADQNNNWWQTAQNKKVKVQVDMPWGVAAIRGTFFGLLVGPNGETVLSVLTGEAQLTAGGQSVGLSGGQQTTITSPTAPPPPPAPLTPQQQQNWAAVANWASQRAADIDNRMPIQPPPPPPAIQVPAPPPPSLPTTQLTQPSSLGPISNLINQRLQDAIRAAAGGTPTNNNRGGSNNDGNTNTTVTLSPGTVTATLWNLEGNPLENKTIDFYLRNPSTDENHHVGSGTTDSSGRATFDFANITMNPSPGQNYQIVAQFPGEGTYEQSAGYTDYTNTDMRLLLNDSNEPSYTLTLGEELMARVILKSNGLPLENQKIKLLFVPDEQEYDDAEGEEIATITTDTAGVASYDLTEIMEENGVGSWRIIAKYAGVNTPKYYSPNKTWVYTFINKESSEGENSTTQMSLYNHYRFADTSTVTLKGSLRDNISRDPITNAEVRLSLIYENGTSKDLGFITTPSDESVTENVYKDIDITDLPLGYHYWRADFAGDETHLPIFARGELFKGGTETKFYKEIYEFGMYDASKEFPLLINLTELASNDGLGDRDIEIAVRQMGDDEWRTLPDVFTTNQYGDASINLADQAITSPGIYEIKASFKGEEGILAPSSATALLKVGEVEFRYFDLARDDEQMYLIVSLKNAEEANNEVTGGKVDFFIDFDHDYDFAASESIGSVPVVDGEAKLIITPQVISKIDLKQYYEVMAVYSGEGYIEREDWNEFTFSNTTIYVEYEIEGQTP